MKVLMVNKKYYPWIGGVERVAQDICEGLKDKVDFTMLVGSGSRRQVEEEVNSVKVIRAGTFFTVANTPICPSMPGILKKTKADIYHFHFPYPWGDISYLLANPKGKLVVTYHSDIIRQKNLLKVYNPIMHRFLSRADAIVATSPNMIKHSSVLSRYKKKAIAIPLAVDTARFEHRDEGRVKWIKEEYGPRIVLFVGRLIYYKGLQYLIKAMKDIDANLLIIGDGPLRKKLENLANELRVSDRIEFLGNKTDEELPGFYQAADVFVLPSIEKTEAFGIVQLEAMISGTPVVSTNLKTGVPFVNKDTETGFVVEPQSASQLAKAVNTILSNQRIREAFSRNAIRRVQKNFTKEIFAENYIGLYQKLMANPAPLTLKD